MDYINCETCQKNKPIPLYEIHGYKIVRCKNCGLVYVNPQPSDQELEFFYEKIFHTPAWFAQFPQLKNFASFKETPEAILGSKNYIDGIVKYKTDGNLLDVGAGYGELLKFAEDYSFQTWGVEPSSIAAIRAKKICRGKIITSTLEKAELPNAFFDVIVSVGTIEHLKSPREAIKKMGRLLKQGGLLVLQSPNIDSWQYRVQKEKWEQFTVPGHLFYFSPKTLTLLLKNIGFQVKFIDQRMPLWAGPFYGSIIENKSLSPKNKYWKYIYGLLPWQIENLLSQFKGKILGKHDLIIYAIKK